MEVIEKLIELGRIKGIDMVHHFGGMPSHIALRLSNEGSVVGAELVKENPVRHPWGRSRTAGIRPNILYDSKKYVIQGGDKRGAALNQHVDLLKMAPRSRGVTAVVKFLEGPAPSGLEVQGQKKDADHTFVYYLNDGKRPIFEDKNLHGPIDRVMRGWYPTVDLQSAFSEDRGVIQDVHMKISLPGLNNNQALVTFDKACLLCTHGRDDRMLHAPITYDEMRLHLGALEWLRENRSVYTPETKPVISFYGWTREENKVEQLVMDVFRGKPMKMGIEEWRESMDSRLEDEDLYEDESDYYLLEVCCSTRISIRGFWKFTVADVAMALRSYYDDFKVPGGSRLYLSPRAIMRYHDFIKVVNGKKATKPSVGIVERIYKSVFLRGRYPEALMKRAVSRHSKRVSKGESSLIFDATINACMSRETTGKGMNPEDSVHYQVGKLFAYLEIRNLKAKDPGDTLKFTRKVRQCSRYPAMVGRLFGTSEAIHKPKIKKMSEARVAADTAAGNKNPKGFRDLSEEIRTVEAEIERLGGYPDHSSPREEANFYLGRSYVWRKFVKESREREKETGEVSAAEVVESVSDVNLQE